MPQARVAVVEGDAAVESLVELYLSAGKAKAAGLLGDLELAAFPPHDVIVC